ncbi:MAG TPA: C4-dicarboxylate ABC transporter permease [Clostridia bacterium]|nr:C4-dicarboxylate ABC transporter permease [Clostridia bacterium]
MTTATNLNKPEKKRFKVPHTYVILMTIVLIAAIMTYIVPAGQYDRVKDEATGRTLVDPASYHVVDQNPTKFFDLFKAIPTGMEKAASIIFFILIVGGAFQIITATGTIEAGVGRAAKALNGKEKLMIPMFLILFSVGGATFGMAEETIVFVPIGVALARALGFDAITGCAMVTLGAACGFNAGILNPFTVGVAQGIAQLPLFSGIGFRIICMVTFLVVTAWYIIRYSEKVKKNPESSIVAELEKEDSDTKIDLNNIPAMELKHNLVLLVLVVGFGFIVYGVFKSGWYIVEIASAFLAMGIFAGLLGGLKPDKVASEFVVGAKSIVFGALVVGIARAILVTLENGVIIDTIINGLAAAVQSLPKSISVVGMYIVQLIISVIIPSGSGLAATTMPIMTPLADIVGITRQTAVLAYQFADGFTNSIIPTSAATMGYLSIAKIPYEKWVKFLAPLMTVWIIAGAIFLIIANAMNYGPF